MDDSTVEELRARLAEATGPANKQRRHKLRLRISKLEAAPAGPRLAAAASASAPSAAAPSASRDGQRGSVPNCDWRAISMCELRAHPYFIALPPPSHYIPPSTAAELRQFREGSPQWCAAHLGRITTSACASCVGLYEERSAEMLGVPPSLRGHGKALDAQARIAQPALGLAEVAAAAEDVPTRSEFEGEERKEAEARAVWHTPDDPSSGPLLKFSRASLRHKWGPLCTPHPRARRELEGASLGRIRLAWGSRQEPTSILAALNYLCRLGAMIEEAGLHPLEAIPPAERGALPAGLPPLGASPDACVRWADGRVEPFEVKNHAPFAARRAPKGSAHQSGAPPLEVRDPGPYDEVAVWHVPQLYLQMLCLGQACHSALFMSCSATRGANLFRLHRHEPTMQRLLGFVARFATQFGGGRPPPPENYFWSDEHRDEYVALLEALRDGSRSVELLARIPEAEVQRASEEPLFWS